jgi:hypothetical protein
MIYSVERSVCERIKERIPKLHQGEAACNFVRLLPPPKLKRDKMYGKSKHNCNI